MRLGEFGASPMNSPLISGLCGGIPGLSQNSKVTRFRNGCKIL